jgi:hypothetical protein
MGEWSLAVRPDPINGCRIKAAPLIVAIDSYHPLALFPALVDVFFSGFPALRLARPDPVGTLRSQWAGCPIDATSLGRRICPILRRKPMKRPG